jgi:hypothetical protein
MCTWEERVICCWKQWSIDANYMHCNKPVVELNCVITHHMTGGSVHFLRMDCWSLQLWFWVHLSLALLVHRFRMCCVHHCVITKCPFSWSPSMLLLYNSATLWAPDFFWLVLAWHIFFIYSFKLTFTQCILMSQRCFIVTFPYTYMHVVYPVHIHPVSIHLHLIHMCFY